MENFLEKLRIHRLLLSSIGVLIPSIVLFFIISYTTPWFMVPIFGTILSLIGAGFGIYHSTVQEFASRYLDDTEPSYRQQIRRLRKQRMAVCKKMYEYRGYSSERESYAKQLKKIDHKIAVERGLVKEPETKPATSRW